MIGDGCQSGNCGWGNQEGWDTSASENISVWPGRADRRDQTATGLTCYYGPCRYTSAKITTRGTLDVAPGRVEARIKLPAGQGCGPRLAPRDSSGTVGWRGAASSTSWRTTAVIRHPQLGDARARLLGQHAVRALMPAPGRQLRRGLSHVCRGWDSSRVRFVDGKRTTSSNVMRSAPGN
jgi:hypothetical protein